MNLTTLGLDLAKNSFSIVGMDQYNKIILQKTLKRTQLLPSIVQCQFCLIGMEACSGNQLGAVCVENALVSTAQPFAAQYPRT